MEIYKSIDPPTLLIRASGLTKTDTRMIRRTRQISQGPLKLQASKTSNPEATGIVDTQMVMMEEEAIAHPLKDRGVNPDPNTRDILDAPNGLEEIVVGVDLERTDERVHIASVQKVQRHVEDVINHGLNTVKKRNDATRPQTVKPTILTTRIHGGLA
jgi:hypothetical protein